MRKGRLALMLAAVVALAAGVMLLLRPDPSPGPSGEGQGRGRPPAASDALTPEGRELAGLLDAGLKGTYHARYRSTIADPRSTGAEVVMDIWRKGDLGRQEVAVSAQGAKSRTATFLLPPQAVECSQVGDKPWACKAPAAAPAPEPPEVQVRHALVRGPIQARDEAIAGIPVRCFTYPPGEDLQETCLLAGGVLARMVTSSSRFDLVAVSSTVADEVFALPAAG